MYRVKYKGETPPTDEEIIVRIREESFSLEDPSEKVPSRI
jgi:hypothetical protein